MAALTRTFVLAIVLVSAVLVVFWRISVDQQQKAIAELTALNEQLEAQLKQHQQMVQRLSRTRRIAHVDILDQRRDEQGEVIETDLQLIELDDNGRELGRQDFTVPGHVIFFDAWTVKFEHEQVAHGHPLLGRSLVLLKRIYSDQLPPRDGLPIDLPGSAPPGYAGSEMSRFEQRVWKHFWSLATDARAARDLHVRVAQGEAVYKPVARGEQYELIVDAAGGMSLRPLERDEDGRALSLGE